ncbi:DUF4355 domain-containing protein [Loigolactobacillus bifermentans]|uniref:DUF4355 domain-containing protein n=1 Tax=Loigolactobacillus bifermentans DSM 20003 TaxID=1423726 RepID=A0A0R1HCI1_9LACO|nr:DUF4355 domain-containing protein [Loigolactobacillus bifermentans]KRK40807.1 hypothetical protein FC07_GL002556 [Loigolactobacillus bifermentans DSM 20003]QGG59559.1 DUF4355 domain-containing protein [Loigolactobacillus bifermentans]
MENKLNFATQTPLKKPFLPMRLQFFAEPTDPPEGGTDPVDPPKDDDKTDPPEPAKKYTDAEVDKIINQKRARWEAEAEHERTEAEKLRKMNDDQKSQYELEKAQQAAESAQNELAKFQMQGTARQMLEEAKVAATAADIELITASDAETTKVNVAKLIDFAARVRKSVEAELLQGNPPHKDGNRVDAGGGSFGARLAQSTLEDKRPNPYFKK